MLSQTIPYGGRNQLREKAYAPFGSPPSNLGARSLRRALHGSHRDDPRFNQVAMLRESGGSSVRGTGMMAGSDGAAVAGGPARHVPVLARPALELLNIRDGGIYIDGTFGAGGYSRAILGTANAQVIGIDRDQSAVANGTGLVEAAGGRLTLIEERFSALDRVAEKFGHAAVDGVVLDLGVSSMQLDEAGRGFSFRLDGPLDMRMGTDSPSAADVVAQAAERDLADIIFQLSACPSSPQNYRASSGWSSTGVKACCTMPRIRGRSIARWSRWPMAICGAAWARPGAFGSSRTSAGRRTAACLMPACVRW